MLQLSAWDPDLVLSRWFFVALRLQLAKSPKAWAGRASASEAMTKVRRGLEAVVDNYFERSKAVDIHFVVSGVGMVLLELVVVAATAALDRTIRSRRRLRPPHDCHGLRAAPYPLTPMTTPFSHRRRPAPTATACTRAPPSV